MSSNRERQQEATWRLIEQHGASGIVEYAPDNKEPTAVSIGFYIPPDTAKAVEDDKHLPKIIFQRNGPLRTEQFTVVPPLTRTPDGKLDMQQPNAEKLARIIGFLLDPRTKAERDADEAGQIFLRVTPTTPAVVELMKSRGAKGTIQYSPGGKEISSVTINFHRPGDKIQEKRQGERVPAIVFQRSGREPLEESFTVSPQLTDMELDLRQPNGKRLAEVVAFLLNQNTEAVSYTENAGWTYMRTTTSISREKPLDGHHPLEVAEKHAAFAEFYKLVEPQLPDMLGYTRRWTGSQLAAEDIVAEALRRALENPPRIESPVDWCYLVIRHLLIDNARRASLPQHPKPFSACLSAGEENPHDQTRMEKANNIVSPDPTPEDHVLTQEKREALRCCIDQLPEAQRVIVKRRLFQGKSYQAIARELGITENAVKMSFSRGMRKVKAQMSEYEKG